MFDHHAIMGLSRMIMEASTMVAYLLDAVEPEEWAFRHNILKLHDTTTRIKLLGAFNQKADDLRAGRKELKAELATIPMFKAQAEERQRRLASGEEMFVIGMRAVAVRIMGWNEAQFNGVYAYLSAHTHSAPVSFMRMQDHQVDYFFPSATQFDMLGVSMEVAIACLRRAMLRIIDQQPEQMSLYQQELLTAAREQDTSCPLFEVPETTTRAKARY